MDRAKVRSSLLAWEKLIREMEREKEILKSLLGEQEKPSTPKRKPVKRLKGAIEEFSKHADILVGVTHDAQLMWLTIYKDPDWINDQITRCRAWCEVKGTVTRNWGQRINNWLANGEHKSPKKDSPVGEEFFL